MPAHTHSPKIWLIPPAAEIDPALARSLRVPDLILRILHNRGLRDHGEIQDFLNPSLNQLAEPARLIGVAPAVRRIRQAVQNHEKVVLYGDYDVDGITGTAILWHCLNLAGLEADYYVPHRVEEGYGLKADAIKGFAKKQTNAEKQTTLIIAIDCGINAHQPAQLAAELGIDLIIVDHHVIEGPLPRAVAVIHPDLPGQDYPCKNLCGAALAFKLAWAVAQDFTGAEKVAPAFREFLINATAFVALGTIADVVPLIGENRVLARFGLESLKNSSNPGVLALIDAAGLKGESISSTDIGYRLAPRLNAAGRMGHARLAVELFTRSTPDRAKLIAQYLEGLNTQRQKVEKEITEQAKQLIAANRWDQPDCRAIVVASENWHAGVIGIVASRIVDTCNRPAFIVSIAGEKASASGRSVPGFDLAKALEHCRDLFLDYGGHAMAAGLNLVPANIDAFRTRLNAYAAERLTDKDLESSLRVDAEVSLSQLDLPSVKLIEKLGPFGAGNPTVLLAARNLRLAESPKVIGKSGDHLQFSVTDAPAVSPSAPEPPGFMPGISSQTSNLKPQTSILRAVAFGKARWAKKLADVSAFDIAFEPTVNRFNHSESVKLIVRDAIFHK